MAIFDFLKNEEEAKKKPAKKEVKPSVKKAEKKVEAKPKAAQSNADHASKITKKGSFSAYGVLVAPHITEKATNLAEENKYTFKVTDKSNKIEVKKAVESNYGVDVVGVRIINIPRRKKRVGRNEGWVKGYKKAIVEVKKGQSIEILPR